MTAWWWSFHAHNYGSLALAQIRIVWEGFEMYQPNKDILCINLYSCGQHYSNDSPIDNTDVSSPNSVLPYLIRFCKCI